MKQKIAKIRKNFLEQTQLIPSQLKVVLRSLNMKDNSLQLFYFLNFLNKSYSISTIGIFFKDICKRIEGGVISFRGCRYPVEEFYKCMNEYVKGLIRVERKVKRYFVGNRGVCPKCKSKLQTGQPYCPKCRLLLKWFE